MSKLILLVATLAGGLLPAAAQAATVHVGQGPEPHYPCCTWGVYGHETVFYVAGPSEVNHVIVSSGKTPGGFPDITITDPGAALDARRPGAVGRGFAAGERGESDSRGGGARPVPPAGAG